MNAYAQCIANAERDLGSLSSKQKADLLLDNFAEIGGFQAAIEIVFGLPKPEVFPVGNGTFFAYDPNRFDVCFDPSPCPCRSSRNNTRGAGKSAEEALADFWEQWEERA